MRFAASRRTVNHQRAVMLATPLEKRLGHGRRQAVLRTDDKLRRHGAVELRARSTGGDTHWVAVRPAGGSRRHLPQRVRPNGLVQSRGRPVENFETTDDTASSTAASIFLCSQHRSASQDEGRRATARSARRLAAVAVGPLWEAQKQTRPGRSAWEAKLYRFRPVLPSRQRGKFPGFSARNRRSDGPKSLDFALGRTSPPASGSGSLACGRQTAANRSRESLLSRDLEMVLTRTPTS